MNMALTSRCFQNLFFIGCSILIADCLEINAFNTLEDGISFSPGSKAIFQCVINPYTGGQTWKVDSVLVADCGFVSCAENSSNPDRYSFMPNVTTGSFIFTIDPILYRDNGNVIECLDGSSTINHTVVIGDLSTLTCDHCDNKTCIYLAILGELLHFIVSIQHIYQSFALYSFQKRIGSIRLVWLNFLAWFPIIGCLIFKGILKYCEEGQCRDCEKQCPAEGYCYNCKGYLCIECFKWHQPLHKTWQIKNTCDECKEEGQPEYCCLKCEWCLCKLCLTKPRTLNNHQCEQRKELRRQGKHKCHDCKKETEVRHYCWICMDHICTDCFKSHFTPEQHTERRQGKHKCHDCRKKTHTREYCWICKDHICTVCFKNHFTTEEHPARTRGKHACHDCKKVTDARHYCWICMDHLCTDCFNIHGTPDQQSTKRQGKHECSNCKMETQTREYSWICKDRICTDCFKSHFTTEQQSPSRQGKHECHDCQKETDVRHYCWICMAHICSDCFSRHFTSDQQSARRQGKHECHNCKKETHTREYSWICKDHICTVCFKRHFTSEQHSAKRQGKHECYDCQKETDTRHYCWVCKNHLCNDCFNSHYTSDQQSARRQGNTCNECKAQCKPPEYCCLKCEWYLCRGCLKKSNTSNNHQCKQRKKGKCLKQGKHKCHDCRKKTDVGHYCLNCEDHICTDCFKSHFSPQHSARKQEATKCKHCDRYQEQANIKGYCLTCNGCLCEHCLETNHGFDKHKTRKIYKEVNNIRTKYKSFLALSCFPGLSWIGVFLLWIICWENIRIQKITFILPAVLGCILTIAHPLVVLKACLASCECEILQCWYIALLALKYIFLGWIPSAIVLVFIKLLEDSFYCDDCKSNSHEHGYCIKCNQYLCGRCVRKHKDMFHYILWHSQKKGKEKYFKTCGDGNERFYCTNSKRFICTKCNDKPTNEHKKYTIRQHDRNRNPSNSLENHHHDTICHDMLSDIDVCYTCFCKLSEIRRHIKEAFNQRLKCQYIIGGVQCQSTSADAYCLTCKLCLCQECLVNHQLHLDGHESESTCLFCDNCLRNDKKIKAEYYNVEFECLLCAHCIRMESNLKGNGHQAEGSQNTRTPKQVKEKSACEVHKAIVNLRHWVEFTLPENTTTDKVRCNVCEMVMCGTCFVEHFNITNILHHYQGENIVREKVNESSDTSQYDVFFACDKCNETQVTTLCVDCKKHLCENCIKNEKEHEENHVIITKKYFHDPLFLRRKKVCQKVNEGEEPLDLRSQSAMCTSCFEDYNSKTNKKPMDQSKQYNLCPGTKIQNDHKGEERPAECLDLGSQHNMCTSCFKYFNSTTKSTHGDQSKQCQLCPDKIKRPVHVYCLVCRGHMCVTCFKWHMRFKQSWQEQGFYNMLEEKGIEEAESSRKRSVPPCVLFRIIAGPILLFEFVNVIRSCCCNATVTPSGQENLKKPKAEEKGTSKQAQSTTDIEMVVRNVSDETKL